MAQKDTCAPAPNRVRQAIDPTDNPVAVGNERVNNLELSAQHSARTLGDAMLAWIVLVEAANHALFIAKTFLAGFGSPSEAWTAIEEWYAPKRSTIGTMDGHV